MEFDLQTIKEYSKVIKKDYSDWSLIDKIQFFSWLEYKDSINDLDNFMLLQQNRDYFYEKDLQKYIDFGFKIIHSRGDEKHPVRDDLIDIFENEKVLFHEEKGIVGVVVKMRTRDNTIKLVPYAFYCEILKENQCELKELFTRDTDNLLEELTKIKHFNTPWTKPFEDIFLTKKVNEGPFESLEIIATFDESIINALGYKKEDGKVYSKKAL